MVGHDGLGRHLCGGGAKTHLHSANEFDLDQHQSHQWQSRLQQWQWPESGGMGSQRIHAKYQHGERVKQPLHPDGTQFKHKL